jgi:hypothetical protein
MGTARKEIQMTDHEKIERPIARRLVATCLEAGYVISVFDGEEFAIKKSDNKSEIHKAMFSTDCDVLHIWSAIQPLDSKRKRIGTITLIYGNLEDVISDYSDNDIIDGLVKKANRN